MPSCCFARLWWLMQGVQLTLWQWNGGRITNQQNSNHGKYSISGKRLKSNISNSIDNILCHKKSNDTLHSFYSSIRYNQRPPSLLLPGVLQFRTEQSHKYYFHPKVKNRMFVLNIYVDIYSFCFIFYYNFL